MHELLVALLGYEGGVFEFDENNNFKVSINLIYMMRYLVVTY